MPRANLAFDPEFFKALQGEDELGLVVRAHIHIEAKVLELLALCADSNFLEKMNLDYSQRVQLAVALGLKEEHARGLQALGKLRNIFAHKLNSSLTDERVDNLYKALSSIERDVIQRAYQTTEANLKRFEGRKFNQLPPRERFEFIVSAMQVVVISAINEKKSKGHSA